MLSFQLYKTDDGYSWRLKAPNGELLLKGEKYTSITSCKNAIQAAGRAAGMRKNFEGQKDKGGHFMFLLKAINGQTLGRSEPYLSEQARERAIELIITNMQQPGRYSSDEPFDPSLTEFIKIRRKKAGLTQEELAERAGVGLRFLRELEQGKETLRMDKVNEVLKMFGHELRPMPFKQRES